MERKILLSTDIGSDTDDALALQTMFNSGINPEEIYVVNGDVNSRAYIAKHMVDLSGKNIGVSIGEANPLGDVEPYKHFEDCHVDGKFIDWENSTGADLTYFDPSSVGINPNGFEDLTDRLSKDKYIIFSIAPLTNIARLVQERPDLAENIERLYIMGCRFNHDPINEHNVRYDIPAAQIVFDSEVPITVVPGNVCSEWKMPSEFLDQLESPSGKYVKEMAKGVLSAKMATEFARKYFHDLIRDRVNFGDSYLNPSPSKEDYQRDTDEKLSLITNMDDSYFAMFSPNAYFEQYEELMDHLRNPRFDYANGFEIVERMEKAIPKDMSIADVYVPYCFLNPDRIKVEDANVSIDILGYSTKTLGDKHQLVAEVDYDHFRDFVQANLK